MDWITTSGRTLDEAKSHALDQLGIVADDAEFDVVSDVEKGLFGRVKTEAKIRARVRPRQTATKDERGRRRNGGGASRNRNPRGKGNGGNDRGGNKNKGGGSKGDGGRSNEEPQAKDRQRQAPRGEKSNQERSPKADNSEKKQRNAENNNDNRQRSKNSENTRGSGDGGRNSNRSRSDNVKRDIVEHEISREDQEQAAQEFLEGVLGAFEMTGVVNVVEEAADDDAIEMVVTGDELGLLVGQKGITLNALQELTRTVVQRKADGAKTDRLRVDVAGYRARRTEALQGFAAKIAADVIESGTEKLLEPMGPADRKVVHDAANGIDGVETGSEGEEPRRRVVIRPT
jgi:spoIIIJ-associated protein